MEKFVIHPGNGLNMPQEGDYVKLNLQLMDGNGDVLFDSALSDKKFAEIRFKTKESNMFQQLEELIGEMSLFEKTSFELDRTCIPSVNSKQIKMLLEQYGKIIFNIEILDINKTPHLI
jgi:hypothetical protein